MFGGLIYCFFRGIVTQYCIKRVTLGDIKTSISSCLIICMYFWNIYGFIISPWIYNSYILAIFAFEIFLFFVHKRVYIGKEKIYGRKD